MEHKWKEKYSTELMFRAGGGQHKHKDKNGVIFATHTILLILPSLYP